MSAAFRFIVLGSGAWGSALAVHLAREKNSVVLWGHDEAEMEAIRRDHANEHYLPGVAFPESMKLTSDLPQAFTMAGDDAIVLIVVPSFAFSEMLTRIKPYLSSQMRVIWATKGLSEEGELFSNICEQQLTSYPIAVLSGPSFAKEVAQGLPTAITIATQDTHFGEDLLAAFHREHFRVYLSQDLVGVQLGGAVKNVLAIAVGMSDGLGFGANARSALITRGLAELCRLGEKIGAKTSTLMGLSGVGDVVLTCTDNQSRNRRFGLALGQGITPEIAQQQIGQVVEGKMNVKQVMLLAKKHHVEMPICQQVYAVLNEGVTPTQAVNNLLTRSPKSEAI